MLFHEFTLTNKADRINAYLACCPRRGLQARTQSTPPVFLTVKKSKPGVRSRGGGGMLKMSRHVRLVNSEYLYMLPLVLI